MAMLVKALDAHPGFEHRLCVTAQHREMLDQVLSFFEIRPWYDLNLMKPGQDLTDITCRVLSELKPVFQDFQPDLVLVHGDTTTCFAGALAAFYHNIPIGHVEAGLRTGNLQSPFPEEANRLLTSRLANWHFAPTKRNVENLTQEGIPSEKISLTGNTVIDSLQYASQKVIGFSPDVNDQKIHEVFQGSDPILLITGHRRENFGQGFLEICSALAELALKYPQLQLVYPVHLNPNVQKPVYDMLKGFHNIHLIAPLAYPDFVYAMKMSWAILTDSGGVQEEAPGLGKPVLVMRNNTERPEAVEAGTVLLVGARQKEIIQGVFNLMETPELHQMMSTAHNPYGDGKAVSRIIKQILNIDQS